MAGVFIFCVDDHPSMASVPAGGGIFSHIDIARSGVDAFLAYYAKRKLHSPLMLLRPAVDKSCIRSYIGDPVNIFEREIKNLAAGDGGGSGRAGVGGSVVGSAGKLQEILSSNNNNSSFTAASTSTDDVSGTAAAAAAAAAAAPPSDFSYALSMAFGIINKHRLKNGVDHFGHGRYPWLLEPTTIFLFTNRRGQSAKAFAMENKLGVASEYVTQPQKWDHRVFLFVLQGDHETSGDEEAGVADLSVGLLELCSATGGDVFVVHSMAEARNVMTRVMSSLCTGPASCAVRMRMERGEFDSQSNALDHRETSLVRLSGKRVGEWPIPEDLPIENYAEELPPRVPVPCLELSADDFGMYRASTLTLTQCMQAIKDYDVPHSVYAIRGKLQQDLNLERGQMYYVSMSVSTANEMDNKRDPNNDSNERPGTPTLRAGVEASRDDFYNMPFAIVSDESNIDGEEKNMRHLLLLPFNFPRCLALIQQGRAVMRKQIAANSNPANFNSVQSIDLSRSIDVWKRDFAQYIQSVPGYYHVPTMSMMQHLGLQALAQGVKVPEYTLHPKPFKKLRYAAETAASDIRDMENVSQQKWLRSELVNPPAYTIALASSAAAQQALPVGPFTSAMPQSAARGAAPAFVEHLAGTWEKMRQVVYGRGSGSFVNGLSVRGISGTVGHVPAGAIGTDWLADACGAARVPCEVVKEMSNYMHVLARQECARDALDIPLDEEESKEEDTERGVLKRKLETVNFGNRYKKSSAKNSARDIGLSAALDSNSSPLVTDNAVANDMTTSTLFGDTPRPEHDYSQTFMLEEAVLLSSQGTLPSPSALPAVDCTSSSQNHAQATRRYRSAADLPPLGRPLSRTASGVADTAGSAAAGAAAGAAGGAADGRGGGGIAAGSGVGSSGSGTRKSPVVVKMGGTDGVDHSANATARVSSVAASYGGGNGGVPAVSPVANPVHASTVHNTVVAATAPVAVTAGNDGWEIQFSAKYGRNYWFNTRTGKSSWEDPFKK